MRRERICNAIAAGIGALALGSFAGAVLVFAAAEEGKPWWKQPARGAARFVQCEATGKDWRGVSAFYYDPDVCNAKCREAVCRK